MIGRVHGLHRDYVSGGISVVGVNVAAVLSTFGMLVFSAYDVVGEDTKSRNLLDVEQLTAERAADIVREQAKKPSFPSMVSSDGIDSLLAAMGVSEEQSSRFKKEWDSAGPIDGQTLPIFLARTSAPECQAVANKFSRFLHLPKLKSLSVDAAEALAKHEGVLNLSGLEIVGPDVAQALAKHKQGLLLYGIKDLSVETAQALARCDALGLQGLKTLGSAQAAALATQRGTLNLSGLQNLTTEAAAELGSNHQGVLQLPRLQSLSASVAEGLSSHRGELHLAGVASLPVDAATALGRGDGDRLVLTGLKTLDHQVADALAPYAGILVVRCPEEIDANLAEALAQHEGGLILTGLKAVATDVALQLSRCKRLLSLVDLVTLEPDAARALSNCPGQLSLLALKKVTPEVASQLAKNDQVLSMDGLVSLDAETAGEFARCRGTLYLPALENLSVEAARQLAKCRTYLHLPGLKKLDPNLADALARCESKSLTLAGLTEVTPQIAQRLARCSADLHLPNLRTLPEQVAEAFARREKGWLVFNGLRSLSREAARELSMCRGDISLSGLDTLTPEVAAELAKSPGTLNLNGLKTLSPELVTALAKHEAHTVVQGVTVLSEDAAMALADCPHFVFSDSVRIVENASPTPGNTNPRQVAEEPPAMPETRPKEPSPQLPAEPAKTAQSVTDIMDDPEEYVNGTYTVPIWIDTSWMTRDKSTLRDGTKLLDGYSLQIKDGIRNVETAEVLGRGTPWRGHLQPVISSKTLARGLQDALPRGTQYRLNATVAIVKKEEYLLMDMTRLEAKRADGTAVVVDEMSTAKDFSALRTVFEVPPAIAAKAATSSQPVAKPSGGIAQATLDATVNAWADLQEATNDLAAGLRAVRNDGDTASARISKFSLRASRIPRAGVDARVTSLVQDYLAFCKKRLPEHRAYDEAMRAWETQWQQKEKQRDAIVQGFAAAGRSPQEMAELMQAGGFMFGIGFEMARKGEWDEIQKKFAGVFEGSTNDLLALMARQKELASALEATYGVPFVE